MDEIIIFTPIILGSISTIFCKIDKNAGSNVSFRPKSYVFSIAWTILYLFIGLSWYYARRDIDNQQLIDVFYTLLNLSLCLWIYVYGCEKNKTNGIYAIVLSIILAMMCYTIATPIISKMLIVPLLGWLFLATLINIFEVEMSKSNLP